MWCPQCRDEFQPSITTCPDCAVALVEARPPRPARPDVLASDLGDDRELLEYELGDWDPERRDALRGWLDGSRIPSAWEGDTLVVNRLWEIEVDGLVAMLDDPADQRAGDDETSGEVSEERIPLVGHRTDEEDE